MIHNPRMSTKEITITKKRRLFNCSKITEWRTIPLLICKIFFGVTQAILLHSFH